MVLGSSGSIAPPQAILANSKNAPIKIAGNQNNIGIVAFRATRWRNDDRLDSGL